ncbi:MAG TPA: hypothetical protein VGR28_01270 [Candidatus Thermoplasmatota archaeon]|jgi:hypothetical protein|nr:hypothetical protein [Candidatus Thermoplasmatota archaeon]
MAKTENLQAAGALLTVGALLLVVGLLAHPAEGATPDAAMTATAQAAPTWRIAHALMTAGALAFAAGSLLVVTAGSRLTATAAGVAGWTVLALASLAFLPVPALEATTATDAAVAGDAATFGAITSVVFGLIQVVPPLFLALAAAAFTEARAATGVARGAAAVGGALALVGFVGTAGTLWFGIAALAVVSNQVLGLAFLWPILLGATLARAGRAAGPASSTATA